jgi:hypothetical protein
MSRMVTVSLPKMLTGKRCQWRSAAPINYVAAGRSGKGEAVLRRGIWKMGGAVTMIEWGIWRAEIRATSAVCVCAGLHGLGVVVARTDERSDDRGIRSYRVDGERRSA